MSYANKEKQREYQREWIRNRREDWFEGKSCKECGSYEDLQLYFKDFKLPRQNHAIWTWNEERRSEILKEAGVLCRSCAAKANRGGSPPIDLPLARIHRTLPANTKINYDIALAIRKARKRKIKISYLMNRFGVCKSTILKVQAHELWRSENYSERRPIA